jgi:hypothetical protein
MLDFRKTQKIFEEQDLSKFFKKPLELLDDELFGARVTSPDTKTYYQVSDLHVAYRKLLYPHPLLPWPYTQKAQARGIDR